MLENVLKEKTAELEPHFKKGFLQRPHTVFQFNFEDAPAFYLSVEEDNFWFTEGIAEQSTIQLYIMNHTMCWNLLQGRTDGMQAFMEGQYRADGNIVLSQLILYLFKPDDPTLIYEVKD